MKKWLSIVCGMAVLLFAPWGSGIDYHGVAAGETGQTPPVAQALVREGEFAVKLAAVLDLGTPSEEAVAEDLLAKAGIAPVNGWLSDYPMTPQIIGQLDDSISKAAGSGKVSMTPQQALKGFYTLASQYNLPTPAEAQLNAPAAEGSQVSGPGPAIPPPEYQPNQYQPNPTVVNNYYYDQGPPVVTYYPPPPDYGYLYDYVPYPVLWFGFWWPGFYVCHDFTTVVVVNSRPAVVSNHIVVASTGAVAIVDPIGRSGSRPVSVIRTGNGTAFRTLADFRTGARSSAVMSLPAAAVRNGNTRTLSGGFGSTTSRTAAANIYSQSLLRNNTIGNRSATPRSSVSAGERRSTYGTYNTPAAPSYSYDGRVGGGATGREQRYGGAIRSESPASRGSAIAPEQQMPAPAPSYPVTPYWRGTGTERQTFGNDRQFRSFEGRDAFSENSGPPVRQFSLPESGSGSGYGGILRHALSSGGRTQGLSAGHDYSGRVCGMRC